MTAFFIISAIVLFILYVVMFSTMAILERDRPKNIIIWSIVFLVSQIVGYIIYIVLKFENHKKKSSLLIKQKEDQIYENLIAPTLYDNSVKLEHEVLEFNNLAFNSKITRNNFYQIFNDFYEFNDRLIEDLMLAKNYIIFELSQINATNFDRIKNALLDKVKQNVMIKIVLNKSINSKLVKELKLAGIKVYKLSKHRTIGYEYASLRNIITIDGETLYLANLNIGEKHYKAQTMFAAIKLKGDVVQDVDVQVHKDTIFASGKFIPYTTHEKANFSNNNYIQFISNQVNTDLELAIIKAICSAKRSIQLQLTQFIPSESIMSLLNFAINSNIEVRLMIPLKNEQQGKYFASRAYAKEVALLGANVYLFDGYINFNAITIDDEYILYGSFVIDREVLNTSPQSLLIIKDNKAIKNFNDTFNKGIDNSYRINNAKFMLLREKFFKNFV